MGKGSDKKNSALVKELILWITLLFSIILILCVFNLCGPLSGIFGSLLFGLFGFMAYLFPVLIFFWVVFFIANRGNRMVTSRIICTCILYIIICALLQLFKSEQAKSVFLCYVQGYKEKSGGGFMGGLISMGLDAVMGRIATGVILVIAAIMLLVFITGKFIASAIIDKSSEKYSKHKEEQRISQKKEEYFKDYEHEAIEDTGLKSRRKYSYTFPKAESAQAVVPEKKKTRKTADIKDGMKEIVQKETNEKESAGKAAFDTEEIKEISEETVTIHRGEDKQELPIYQKEINEKFGHVTESAEHKPASAVSKVAEMEESKATTAGQLPDSQMEGNIPKKDEATAKPKAAPETADEEITPMLSGSEPIKYVFPSLDLLNKPKKGRKGMSDKELQETAVRLRDCLKSFKVDVTLTDIICGPTVTRYELMPALGTRVKKITELENDIKLNLAVSDIRIEAPIPGKSAVGIEVPNSDDSLITLREILESNEFVNHKSKVAFAVGKDISGRNIVADIAKMPHLLIAGSTGSGKSVCINTIVMSIIYKADPNDVKLIMVDPKVVELSVYNGIPHLCIPVVTDPKKAAAALNWAVAEMNDRYSKFAEFGVRDMAGFNKKVEKLKDNPENYTKMPQIVIIVDELADLMMVASHDVETAICRLAQMARAAGLHLIIATQRPSVDVITGLIKANVPSRIAFAVSSAVDSRTILDGAGAEKLLGKGDMLFYPQDISKPIRVQGAFVSDGEVAKVTDFIKSQYDEPVYNEDIKNQIENTELTVKASDGRQADMQQDEGDTRDELFGEAGRFIIEKEKASIGTLQRVFKIGFNRGARIMDQLCEAGVVSEEEGKKPRNILMTLEEFEQMLAEGR